MSAPVGTRTRLVSPVALLVATVVLLAGLVPAVSLAYLMGHTDARLDAPITCGDPTNESGVVNKGRLRW